MSIDSQAITVGVKKYPIIVLCGLISVGFAAVLYYRSDLQTEQEVRLATSSAQIARYRANIANAVQLEDQLDFLIQANNAVKARALSVEGIAQNLQFFYRLETECGVKYLDLRPSARAVAGTKKGPQQAMYVPINYTVGVQGNFNQIIFYLRRLEQGVYFCRINTASISGNESGVTLNLNLDMLGVK
jgi:hypothetical protein